MLLKILFLFCFIYPQYSPNPLVCIVRKNQHPPIILSSGLLLNAYYVLTTHYPIGAYTPDDLCILTETRLSTIHPRVTQHFCYGIKNVFYPDSYLNLVLLEPVKPFFFFYGMSPATVPLGEYKGLVTDACLKLSFYMDRKRQHLFKIVRNIYLPNSYIKSVDTTKSEQYIKPVFNASELYCPTYNGAPFYCEFMVVGVLAFVNDDCAKTEFFDDRCLTLCGTSTTPRYVNLMKPKAQAFIRQALYGLPGKLLNETQRWKNG